MPLALTFEVSVSAVAASRPFHHQGVLFKMVSAEGFEPSTPQIKSLVLYRLSYTPVCLDFGWGRGIHNPIPNDLAVRRSAKGLQS